MKSNVIHREIKSYLAKNGITLTEVVRLMNLNRSTTDMTTVQNLSNKLTRGTIKYSEVLEIASILNMHIVWHKNGEEGKQNV